MFLSLESMFLFFPSSLKSIKIISSGEDFFFNVLTGAFLGNFPLPNSIVCQWAIQCVVEKLHHKTHCFFMASLQIYLDNVHFE